MKTLLIAFLLVYLVPDIANSQSKKAPEPINQTELIEISDSLKFILSNYYVFPEKAEEMIKMLDQNLKKKVYKDITDPADLAERLTMDLFAICHDKHLRIFFSPETVARLNASSEPDIERNRAIRLKRLKANNFGFEEIKILDGNIGYLNLTSFVDTRFSGKTAEAAMEFLSNTDALIIDIRQNGGGSPSLIQLISSYFFESDAVHLNTFYWRPRDEYVQKWTLPHINGTRNTERALYILTSGSTFSAAEEFCYNLQNLKRATLVGATTGGGAHPGDTRAVTDRFAMFIPMGRAINPVTGTNWEGTGVIPDIEEDPANALNSAHLLALENLIANYKDEGESPYDWYIPVLKAWKNPIEIDQSTLKSYAGVYGPRVIIFENGQLYYQREGRPKYKLNALAEDLFMFEENRQFRLQVLKENGEIIGLMGHYMGGYTDKSMKSTGVPSQSD